MLIKDDILTEATQVAKASDEGQAQRQQLSKTAASRDSHQTQTNIHINNIQHDEQANLKAEKNLRDEAAPSQTVGDNEDKEEAKTNGKCTSLSSSSQVLTPKLSMNVDASQGSNEQPSDFVTIIHFNDCYNVEPGPESSGAAGFLTAVNQYRHLNPLILFSGDIISPSFMSTFTKGEQMIPVLNDIGVHCAVFGNHEFDYGVDNLIEFTRRTTFPWLLSNVIDKETSSQLGEGKIYHIIERQGIRFGLIGLIEEEWLSTLSTLDSSDVIYQDFVERGRELACSLKNEPHNVDYVIALTHFRTPNDLRLADSVPEIDLILGGHDHDYDVIKRPNCYIIKSGTDFREFSLVKLKLNEQYVLGKQQSKPIIETRVERICCQKFEPNKELKEKLEKFVSSIDEKMGKILGQFACDLDGRFSSIRKYETNLGNFVTDIMLASTHADLAILNSGTLRSDRIHPKGDFTMRDLFNILGYIDPISVLQASGYHIWQALENGVSQWPKLEGRFPQVSGCSFTFDPNKPAGKRIDPASIFIGDEPLVLDKQYRLTTKAYLASGKDGYDILKECKTLVPGDESPDLTTSILNHFEAINIVKSNRRTHHRQSIICLSRSSLKRLLDSQQQFEADALAKCDGNNNSGGCNKLGACHQMASFDQTADLLNEARIIESHNEDDEQDEILGQETSSCVVDQTDGSLQMREHHPKRRPTTSTPLVGSSAPTPTTMTTSRHVNVDLSSPRVGASCQQKPRTKRIMSLYEMEHEQCKLEPKTEGRIRILGFNV